MRYTRLATETDIAVHEREVLRAAEIELMEHERGIDLLSGGRPDDWYPSRRTDPVPIATKEA